MATLLPISLFPVEKSSIPRESFSLTRENEVWESDDSFDKFLNPTVLVFLYVWWRAGQPFYRRISGNLSTLFDSVSNRFCDPDLVESAFFQSCDRGSIGNLIFSFCEGREDRIQSKITYANIIGDKWGNKTLKRGDEYDYIKCTIDVMTWCV